MKLLQITAQEMEAVPNLNVDIGHLTFNLAYPNIIMWSLVIVFIILFFYLRLPNLFKPKK